MLRQSAGENQVQTEKISRGKAGAAVRKVICPPAYCVGRPTQWSGAVAICSLGWTNNRKRGTEKPGKALDPSRIAAARARD